MPLSVLSLQSSSLDPSSSSSSFTLFCGGEADWACEEIFRLDTDTLFVQGIDVI